MIAKVSLIGFMAHADTELELAAGLNVLTGPNNTGKSAVVEALRCLTQNPPPHHVIRHGAGEARVAVTLDDGTVVAWVRRPKYALYELTRPGRDEPEVFAKFGRTPPEAILAALRLDVVTLETGETVDVHIGNQRQPVFLLNQPGTVVAGFFAAASEAAHLLAMQHRLTDRVRKAKGESRRLETRLADVLAALDRLAPLPDLERRLGLAEELEAGLVALAREMPALARLLDRGRALRQQLAGAVRTGQALAGLAAPPPLSATGRLAELLGRRGALLGAQRHVVGRQTVLARLAAPPALAACAPLVGLLTALEETRRQVRHGRARSRAWADLAAPPALAETAGLIDIGERLGTVRRAAAGLAARTDRLAGLHAPPDIAPVAPLAETVRAIAAGRAALAAKQADLADRTRAVQAAADRIGRRLEALGVCPLCGSRLSAAAFLGLAAEGTEEAS